MRFIKYKGKEILRKELKGCYKFLLKNQIVMKIVKAMD